MGDDTALIEEKDEVVERLQQQREDAILWAQEGYATAKYDRCQRHGLLYSECAECGDTTRELRKGW